MIVLPPPSRPAVRRSRRPSAARARGALATAALAASALLATGAAPAAAAAQMPGVPLLQNGFVRPGTAVAANYGAADGTDVVGAAGAWTPGSARFQVSAGAGSYGIDGIDARKTSGGLRVALPVRTPWTRDPASALGITGFLGVGGASLDDGTLVQVPIGVGVGYRRPLGGDRAVSVFATPFFQWTRVTGLEAVAGVTPEVEESSLFRISLGAEALLTRRIGVTLGYELGTSADEGSAGPAGGIFGAGLAFVF